jgi:hypothetical protein
LSPAEIRLVRMLPGKSSREGHEHAKTIVMVSDRAQLKKAEHRE